MHLPLVLNNTFRWTFLIPKVCSNWYFIVAMEIGRFPADSKCTKDKKVLTPKEKREEVLRNKLLPRVFQYKLLKDDIKSDQRTVIVSSNQNVWGFKLNCYTENTRYLKEYISKEDFDDTVMQANSIIEREVTANKKKESKDAFPLASFFLLVSVGLSIAGISLMAVTVYWDFWGAHSGQEQILQYVAMSLLLAASVFVIVVVINIQTKQFVPCNLEKNIKDKLDIIIEERNREFVQEGRSFLTWSIDNRFFWLRFNIDLDAVPEDFQTPREETQNYS